MQTVLIIDDEFGIVEALIALLTDEGFRAHSAPDGKQGLAKLDEVQPDVIMLDFMMPVIDGAGVLQALRAHPVWRNVPVIMMSAVPEPAVRKLCGDGFQAFLHKPFNVDELLKLLRRSWRTDVPAANGSSSHARRDHARLGPSGKKLSSSARRRG
jgi:CheY-like chemotaxis protein